MHLLAGRCVVRLSGSRGRLTRLDLIRDLYFFVAGAGRDRAPARRGRRRAANAAPPPRRPADYRLNYGRPRFD